MNKTIRKKAKSGKFLTNIDRSATLKRKRQEIEKRQILNDIQADKVYMPPEHLQNNDAIPLGKE
jgi:hypothetical protein